MRSIGFFSAFFVFACLFASFAVPSYAGVAEGKKAFEAAYKKHIKEYLKGRMDAQEKTLKSITTQRDALVAQQKATQKPAKVRILQTRIGNRDHAIYRTRKAIERSKSQQKNF